MIATRVSSAFADLHKDKTLQYLLLAAITLLAAVLRLYKLGEWSFWIDEVFTVNRAQFTFASFSDPAGAVILPPVSVVLTGAALHLFGVTEWSARIVPAIAGAISIPALYFLTRRIFDPAIALIASLLLAVSPWHIYWSQNARFYIFLLLFYSLAMLVFFMYTERPRVLYIPLFWVLILLAVRERQTAFLLLPVIVGYLLALRVLRFSIPDGARIRSVLLLLGPPAVAFGVYELNSLRTVGMTSIAYTLDVLGGLIAAESPVHLLTFILFNIGLPLVGLAVLSGVYLVVRRDRAGLFFLLGAVVPIITLLLLNRVMFTKDRYAFVVVTSVVILGAVAAGHMLAVRAPDAYSKLLYAGLLAVLLVHAAGDNLLYYQVNHGNRLDWKGSFALVDGMRREGDMVVSTWEPVGTHYLGPGVISWWDLEPEAVRQTERRTWFVVDEEVVWINMPLKAWVEDNAELIDVTYLRLPNDFYLRTYLYDPAQPRMR